jgi:hypothetical protein
LDIRDSSAQATFAFPSTSKHVGSHIARTIDPAVLPQRYKRLVGICLVEFVAMFRFFFSPVYRTAARGREAGDIQAQPVSEGKRWRAVDRGNQPSTE